VPRYVVEREFPEPVSNDALQAVGKALGECLPRHGTKHLGSLLSADRKRMICQFDAPGAEEVKDANRSAGAAFYRVWQADWLGP
jgi:hypothetical protein